MSNVVVLAVVFVLVAMIDSSGAVICYQCNYTRSSSSLRSSCGGLPFNPDTKKKCSGSICSWQLSYYTAPTIADYIDVQYDCRSDSGTTSSDLCAQYRTQYSVFNYEDSCCYRTRSVDDDGTSNNMTVCLCQSDDCNGNIPETVHLPMSTPLMPISTTRLPIPGQPNSSSAEPLLKPPIWIFLVVAIAAMVRVIG